MYAYKEQYNTANRYGSNSARSAQYQTHNNQRRNPISKQRKKKESVFFYLLRTSVVLAFLSAFGVLILPTAYNSLIKQIVTPNKFPITFKYQEGMMKNPAKIITPNLYSISNPVTNYIHNDMYNNTLLLTPTIQKAHSDVSNMYVGTEMAPLKNQLLALGSQYKSIKPSVYVWEYEQGRYVNINASKLYPSASIIKLPVLVRLFKSIEANQLTIYDEMIMKEQYRSSGSGGMQFKQANHKYTIDALAKTMIQDSDNTATNMIMSKIGGMDDINTGLRDWGISDTYVRTWLPDLGGTNKTTAKDMAKILYNLDNPAFLNINSREYIIDYMSHVKNNRLIQAGLDPSADFIHKTGDIGSMLGDAGIVYAQNGKKYIVVILVERPYNSTQGKDYIVAASKLIYNYIVSGKAGQ